MSEDGGDDWSSPSLYARGGMPIAPPTMLAEADPISSVLLLESSVAAEPAHEVWSDTTYGGRRRHRPRADRPARTAAPVASPDLAVPDSPVDTAVAVETAEATETAAATEPAGTAPRADRGLLANSRTMAVASLASRLTGFVRSSLLVAALGVGQVGDAYNVANNFPNMVYELLLGGVLSSVLIPLLVQAQERDSDDGVAYTQRLLSIATAALGAVTLLAVAAAPLIAGAFVHHAEQRSLATLFATLLLPEIFFYGLGAMFMAVLNIRHSYGPGAWSPVLNNVVLIVTVVVFWALPGPATLNPTTMTTPQILVVGIGTTLGIAAQALVLVPSLRNSGFHWKWRFRARPNEIGRMKEVGTIAAWVLGYVVASQIGVSAIAAIGVAHHAFTVFTQADLLVQMPYGILVVSLLTALMPRLSRAAARDQRAAVVTDLGLGARLSAVTLVPITAGLIVLAPALCVVIFGYGETSIAHARLIGTALAASAFGLFPFALVMLQLRVFYAMRDGRTPTLINIFMVTTKVALVVVADNVFDSPARIAEALTVATSASYVVGAIVGHVALTRRLGPLRFGGVAATFTRIAAASVLGGAAAFAVVTLIGNAMGRAHVGSLVALLLGALAGLVVLAAVLWRMKLPELGDMAALARR